MYTFIIFHNIGYFYFGYKNLVQQKQVTSDVWDINTLDPESLC